MTARSPFDRQAPCPNCGAAMTFKFAGARAQVCKYCKFLVARTDRGLVRVGQVADLVEIPSPLEVNRGGYWDRNRFEVEGRVQLDRVNAASAPWQEFYLVLPDRSEGYWIAFAQGRWYWTREVTPTPTLPPLSALTPGAQIRLDGVGLVTIAEIGRRKVISAEGELANVAAPGVATAYADFGGPNGVFGTIDFGDSQSIPPQLYVGQRFDPKSFKLDSGAPLEAAQAKVEACTCPNCGGSLPLVAPGTTERIVCKYCGTISDVRQGALAALGQAPKPPFQPFIPLGAEGTLRGRNVIMIGFVVRGTWVEGEHYSWREYLAYAGPSEGYVWLMEEENRWQLVVPVGPGEAQISEHGASYAHKPYRFKQRVNAQIEYVVGEFYWKVEVGEQVEATEYQGSDGILSVERDRNEVNISFCMSITPQEIAQAFKIAAPPSPALFTAESKSKINTTVIVIIVVIVIILLLMFADCDGSGGGGPVFGPGFGGK